MKTANQKIQEEKYLLPYHWFPKPPLKQFEFDETKRIFIDFFQKHINQNEINFLDLGCGDGRWTYEISKILNNSFLTVGIDYSFRSLSFAKLISPEINFINQDAVSLPFKDNYFDLITLIEVIEHIDDNNECSVIQEVHRVLNIGGIFIITTPSKNVPINKKHFRHYSINELESLVIDNGFDIVEKCGQSINLPHFINKTRLLTANIPALWKLWKFSYTEKRPDKSVRLFIAAKKN
jgi:ubiquinone/menaquinone biosynthesis C-methylase UbiE